MQCIDGDNKLPYIDPDMSDVEDELHDNKAHF